MDAGRLNQFYKLLFVLVALMTLVISYIAMHRHSYPIERKIQYFNGSFYLGQGWNQEQRQKFSYASFGSRIVPYEWFLALEQADTTDLFREASHMTRLGFIVEAASQYNPDGLPIGFSRDSDQQKQDWVGFTCAACHTGQVEIHNQKVRIDGGQSLIDFTGFEQDLLAALKATLNQPDKWQRFTQRLAARDKNFNSNSVRKNLTERIESFEKRFAMNASDTAYGHGRLDAFGQIFNTVAADALHLPENRRSPDAPTSFPFLWNASHLDLVQWNASAPNTEPGPLFQNVTAALAVYGDVSVNQKDLTYQSSVNIKNLGFIQASLYDLHAPKWPKHLAGDLDTKLIEQGKAIYQAQCVMCHALVDENANKYKLNAVAVPIEQVGTDPRMAKNFTDGTVKTGVLQGKKMFVFAGDKFGAQATRLDEVMHVAAGSTFNQPINALNSVIEEFQIQNKAAPNPSKNVYKARPLAGIWATAPYLHNGSVPTVYDLLLPPDQRPIEFYVGNHALDTVKLGYVYDVNDSGTSFFDTRLLGNSNAGHLYGTQLPEADRMALLEYLKSL